jgi:integrase
MASLVDRLTDREVRALGVHDKMKHHDGKGLYLVILPTGTKSWRLRFWLNGLEKQLVIGPYPSVSIKAARDARDAARTLLRAGIDPTAQKKADAAVAEVEQRNQIAARQAQRAAAAAKRKTDGATLRTLAESYHAGVERKFRNEKHRAQWLSSLERHVLPTLGDRQIATLTPGDLLDVLEPLYRDTPETGRRVRQRLEAVFDRARLRGLCAGNAAAAVKRELKRKRDRTHFRALDYRDAPALLRTLRGMYGSAPKALEFLMLTAARTGEVIGMKWSELDDKLATWTVPAKRMKAQEEHVVHISAPARAILQAQKGMDEAYVFPSAQRPGHPMSDMAMLMVLKRLGDKSTVHGLRSSFSTWANECGHRPDAIEACLAHREQDRVRAAYNRGEFVAERRRILDGWGVYLSARPRLAVARKRA